MPIFASPLPSTQTGFILWQTWSLEKGKSHRVLNQENSECVQTLECLLCRNNPSQTAYYEKMCCSGARSTICFFTSSTISYELALAVLSKPSNSKFGLQFDPLEPIQSSRCHWCKKKKKTVSIALNFDFHILTFFILGDTGGFQYMDCSLVSASYWNIQVSSQVMVFSINSDFSSDL